MVAACVIALGWSWATPGCQPRTTDRDIEPISLAELSELIRARDGGEAQAVFLLDPRSRTQFAQGHIPGAVNLLLSDLPVGSLLDPVLDEYDNIVVYGTDPGSSPGRAMTKRLIALGYDDVRWFDGGLRAWRDAGGEVATLPGATPAADSGSQAGGQPASP